VAVVPSGLAGTINDGLQPALEDAMGIDLVVNSVFETGSAGNNVVTLTYAFGETLPSLENGSAALTEAIEGLGGNVTFSISAAGGASAAFEKVEVGEFVLTGNLSLSENGIVAQLTIGG
jgi:hypothetical protein